MHSKSAYEVSRFGKVGGCNILYYRRRKKNAKIHEFTFSVETLISGRCRVIYETRGFDMSIRI
jgi:hypothetical protein